MSREKGDDAGINGVGMAEMDGIELAVEDARTALGGADVVTTAEGATAVRTDGTLRLCPASEIGPVLQKRITVPGELLTPALGEKRYACVAERTRCIDDLLPLLNTHFQFKT